jgi:hypothetical protein
MNSLHKYQPHGVDDINQQVGTQVAMAIHVETQFISFNLQHVKIQKQQVYNISIVVATKKTKMTMTCPQALIYNL